MPPEQTRKAAEDSPSVLEASKRVQRSEKEKGSRPSFLDATEMVKINVFESPSNDNKEDDEGVNSAEVTKKTFLVHKAILCHYSSFFNAAFNGGFAEDAAQELDLPDTGPILFSIFVEWIYSQRVTMSITTWNNDILTLTKLWVLADRCLVPRLQNETLGYIEDSRVTWKWKFCPASVCAYVYDSTTDRSPLRQYLADLYSHDICLVNLPPPMLADIITCTVKHLRVPESNVRRVGYTLCEEQLRRYYVPLRT
ncbi:hypothetical protein LOCC1_G003360 [Lachnellula occidentalis]|uniref:BTB domain-containing protein n=1 Tax=Lachnellula occidentalis TaxID=215460 RepID=A0A8H8S0V8_9HELO|nr:hypothetical protein LOCC1_G003360 [Lachnellula occidentalis]